MRIIERSLLDATEVNCYTLSHGLSVKTLHESGSSHSYSSKPYLLETTRSLHRSQTLSAVLTDTFLPAGFPNTVRPEYLEYQAWDSIQGISSYLRGVLTSRSVLAGAGIGSAKASAVNAAILWAIKDGIGMISGLVLAYHCASRFEIYFKEWRFVADLLNNVGLFLDLLTSIFPTYFSILASSGAICHSCCGLIAGATKARISTHLAIRGNVADITAKESTQETAVALIGLLVGMLCARIIDTDVFSTWIVFIALTALHAYANYRLMRALVIDVFNPQRAYLLAINRLSKTSGVNPTPSLISSYEKFTTPLWLSLVGPKLGVPLRTILDSLEVCYGSESVLKQYKSLRVLWIGSNSQSDFVIGMDRYGRPVACLSESCGEAEMLRVYMLCVFIMNAIGESSLLPLSDDELKRRYSILVDRTATEAKIWFDELIGEQLSSWGWDCISGHSRMGASMWRLETVKDD